MSRKVYEVVAVTGTYTVNGQEKKNWLNVGAMFENDKGQKFIMLKAHFNPAAIERQQGQDSIPLYLFEPKNNNQNQEVRQYNQQQRGEKHDFSFDEPYNSGVPF